MSDDQKKQHGAPLNPTTDAGNMMGDTYGLTGITQPGVDTPVTQEKEMVSDSEYDQNTQDHMSAERAAVNREIGSEVEEETDAIDTLDEKPFSFYMTPPGAVAITTTAAPNQHEYNQGEQSISGSTPDPESDDDTLQNAQAVGFQLEEDEEHPQELDMARDMDNAEEYHRTH